MQLEIKDKDWGSYTDFPLSNRIMPTTCNLHLATPEPTGNTRIMIG
jgi:hypothetical protein